MFSSSFFSPEFFGNFFKITGTPVLIKRVDAGVKDRGVGGTHVNLAPIRGKGFHKDEEDILEFIITFVLNRSS